MKKIAIVIVVMIVVSMCLGLSVDAATANKVDLLKTEGALQKACGVLKTDLGTAEIKYNVIKKHDYYEVQADVDYGLFQNIQYGYYKLKDKQEATGQIKEFTQKIYKTVISLYPDIKWHGFYCSTFESISGGETSRIFFNWCNFKSDKIVKDIQWMPEKDNVWELGIWEELEK